MVKAYKVWMFGTKSMCSIMMMYHIGLVLNSDFFCQLSLSRLILLFADWMEIISNLDKNGFQPILKITFNIVFSYMNF